MSEKYLLYLDILGFGPLANQIAKEKGIDAQEIRLKFINTIKERISFLKSEQKICGTYYDNGDSWILAIDTYDQVLENISIILDHETHYEQYRSIPIEFAIGTGKYDKWVKFDGNSLIIENSTIDFLKTKIIQSYHNWFGKNITQSYALITQSAYDQLEPIDRVIWKLIDFPQNSKNFFYSVDCLIIQEKSKIFNFLHSIGHIGTKRYRRIDETYVEPLEYDEIVKSLSEKHIVFIVGTQEFGKTFTAVKLLWEFFKVGYKVKWEKGEGQNERKEVRTKLENIQNELKSHHIIYFEDPFGLIKYEDRKGLEREISTIIDTIRQVPDTFVIITSREEVFKEFEKETVSADLLNDFEKKLNIKRNSYDNEKRKQILLKYAIIEKCDWLSNKDLKKMILGLINDKKNLPTPLSLSSFAISTSRISNRELLREKIIVKSEETAKAFAKEFINFSDDKKLFLSFPFIATFPYDFVEQHYSELVKEIKNENAWEFKRILSWFKDDKIDFGYEEIEFSHPSYQEALKYLLTEDGNPTFFNVKIFLKVLVKVLESENDYLALNVFRDYFQQIPLDIAMGYLSLFTSKPLSRSNCSEYTICAIEIITRNYSQLKSEYQEFLMTILNLDNELYNPFLVSILNNYKDLSDDLNLQKIIIDLADKQECEDYLASAIINNYYNLPKGIKKLFKEKIASNNSLLIAIRIAENFDNHPQELQQLYYRLVDDEKLIKDFLYFSSVDESFNCPPKLFYDILAKMEKSEESFLELSYLVEHFFDIIDGDFRGEIIKKISKNKKSSQQTAIIIISHFEFLSQDVQSLIFDISEDTGTHGSIAIGLSGNFEKLPDEYRQQLIRKVAFTDRVVPTIVYLITKYFSSLPVDIQDYLIEYSKNEKWAIVLPGAIIEYFEKLPNEIRNLIEILAENPKLYLYVCVAIIQKYPRLPQKGELLLTRILNRFVSSEESLQVLLPVIIMNYENLPLNLKKIPRTYYNIKNFFPVLSNTFIHKYSILHMDMKKIFWDFCYLPGVVDLIISNMVEESNLDTDLIALLDHYAEGKATAYKVAISICKDADYVDSELRTVFIKSISDPGVFEKVCLTMENNPELFNETDTTIIGILTEKRDHSEKFSNGGIIAKK